MHWFEPHADAVFERSYEAVLRSGQPIENHLSRLAEAALHVERSYIAWRSVNLVSPMDVLFNPPYACHRASYVGLTTLPHPIHNLMRSSAQALLDHRIERFDQRALAVLDRVAHLPRHLSVMSRTLRRAAYDFRDFSRSDFETLRDLENQRALEETVCWGSSEEDNPPVRRAVKRRNEKKRQRKLRRSIDILSSLIGYDKVRDFLRGKSLRLAGRKAVFEVVMPRSRDLLSGYPGHRNLKVFSAIEPETRLCNLCIGSPEVPMLDHVASLVLHVASGQEDEILRIGNAMDITEQAWNTDWIKPFLGERGRATDLPRLQRMDVVCPDEDVVCSSETDNMGAVPMEGSCVEDFSFQIEPPVYAADLDAEMERQVGLHILDRLFAPYADLMERAGMPLDGEQLALMPS